MHKGSCNYSGSSWQQWVIGSYYSAARQGKSSFQSQQLQPVRNKMFMCEKQCVLLLSYEI